MADARGAPDGGHRSRTIGGIRAALLWNFGTLPFSFVTNLVLGRLSPEALGAYGGVQILVGTSFTFLVFGGANVFTRFVPALDARDRVPFLRAYGAIVGAAFLCAVAVSAALPAPTRTILASFGSPSAALALGMLAGSVVCGMACWYLYADGAPTWAVVSEKLVVLGFFAAAVAAWVASHATAYRPGVPYVWHAALAVYVTAAAFAAWRVTRAGSFARRGSGWRLPKGFWPVVGYTHVDALVTYVWAALAPTVVLFWVDLRALGFLHAALRYTVLLTAFPAAVMAVLGPELRRLVAQGRPGEAIRDTEDAIHLATLALAPAVLGLVLFAEPAMAFFGPGFREHADVLRFAAPSALAAPVILCGAGAAVAVGAFGPYLRASILYVIVAVSLVAFLVPRWGVPGAAAATSLGALARQIAITTILRREGYVPHRRMKAAWGCAAAAVVAAEALRPSLSIAALLFVASLATFVVVGGLRRDELSRVVRLGFRHG